MKKTDEDEERCSVLLLTLEVDRKIGGLRATERSEVRFRENGEVEVIPDPRISKGWGIVTPEGNLFFFMDTKSDNPYYYLMIEAATKDLTLLHHARPFNWSGSKTLHELKDEITLRKFMKVAELNGNNREDNK